MSAVLTTLDGILNNVYGPLFEGELGSRYRTESGVERIPTQDGFRVVTSAELILPRAQRELILTPGKLVKSAAAPLLTEIVEEHLKPFRDDLRRAAADTTAAWMLATERYQR